MKIATPITMTTADQLRAGELFVMRYGGPPALAVACEVDPSGKSAVLILNAPAETRFRQPFRTHLQLNGSVIGSLGTDWILEPIFVAEATSYIYQPKIGEFFLTEGRALLGAGVDQAWSAAVLMLDMTTWTVSAGASSDGIGFTRWRIWANESAMKDPRAEPLFEFKGPEASLLS